MFKKMGLTLAVLAVVVVLTACGSATPNTGDFYQAMGQTEQNGWTYYVAFEMDGTDISSFTFDAVQLKTQESRSKAKLATMGLYNLAPGNVGEWDVQAKLIEEYIIKNDGVNTITFNEDGTSDAITGATIKYGEIIELMNQAIAAGPVEKGTITDAVYFGQMPTGDEDMSTYQVAYFVNHDVILGVHLDGTIIQDNVQVFKTDLAAAGEYVLDPTATASFLQQLSTLEDFIIKNQGFTNVVVNDEGRTDGITGATISIDGFISAFNAAR